MADSKLPSLDELNNAAPKTALPSINDLNAGSTAPSAPAQEPEAEPRDAYKITEAEVNQIAKKHGVSPDFLQNEAPWRGGSVDTGQKERSFGDVANRFKGKIYSNLLLGVPQYLAKKQMAPNEQAAIDEMVDRMKTRDTLADLGTDLLAGAPAMALGYGAVSKVGTAVGVGGKALTALQAADIASQGAVRGYTNAHTGEEVKGATVGAVTDLAFAGVLAGAGYVGGRLLDRAKARVTDTVMKKWVDEQGGAKVLERVAEARAPHLEEDAKTFESILSKGTSEAPPKVTTVEEIPASFQSAAEAVEFTGARPKGLPASPDAELVAKYNQNRLASETISFAQGMQKLEGKSSSLSLEEAQKFIDEKLATEGKEFLAKQFQSYKDVQASYALLRDDVIALKGPKGGWLERAVMSFSDVRPMTSVIDKRNGTNLGPVIDRGSMANNQYTLHMHSLSKDTIDFAAQVKGLNTDNIIQAMRNQDISQLNPAERRAAETLNALFEKSRLQANELGVPIQRLRGATGPAEFYVPDHMMDPADVIVAIRGKVDEVNAALTKRYGAKVDIRNLSPQEFPGVMKDLQADHDELLRGLRVTTNLTDVESSLAQFTGALKASQNAGKASQLMDISASAAFRRDNVIPQFLKENDPIKLLNNWQRDTFRAAYFREPLEELRTLTQHFVNAGDKNAASLTQNLVLDLTGRQRGTLGNYVRDTLTQISVNAKDSLRKGEGNRLTEMLAQAPDYYTNLTNQVYPNFLAWNPRSVVTNATQPIMMVVPELGAKYGPKMLWQGYADIAKTLATGQKIKLSANVARELGKREGEEILTKDLELILHNKGVMGANWNQELIAVLSQGIKETSVAGEALGKANHFMNEVGMLGFSKAELANRFATDSTARAVARDFIAGHPDAVSFFRISMGTGYQREVMQAMAAKDFQTVENLFSTHLVAKTAFHYDRWTMSEVGRYVGPGLSAFTKWPTVIAGDIASQFMTKSKAAAAGNVARRYVAPLVLVNVVQHVLMPDDIKEHSLYKSAFGKEGLAKASPLSSLKDVAEGRVAKPPLVSATTDLTTGTLSALAGDPEKLWKWANNTVYSYTPQAGFVRFLSEDVVPRVREGIGAEKPQGTFSGKVQQMFTGENTLDEMMRKEKN